MKDYAVIFFSEEKFEKKSQEEIFLHSFGDKITVRKDIRDDVVCKTQSLLLPPFRQQHPWLMLASTHTMPMNIWFRSCTFVSFFIPVVVHRISSLVSSDILFSYYWYLIMLLNIQGILKDRCERIRWSVTCLLRKAYSEKFWGKQVHETITRYWWKACDKKLRSHGPQEYLSMNINWEYGKTSFMLELESRCFVYTNLSCKIWTTIS